jgi:hypothetical protein
VSFFVTSHSEQSNREQDDALDITELAGLPDFAVRSVTARGSLTVVRRARHESECG